MKSQTVNKPPKAYNFIKEIGADLGRFPFTKNFEKLPWKGIIACVQQPLPSKKSERSSFPIFLRGWAAVHRVNNMFHFTQVPAVYALVTKFKMVAQLSL